MKITIIIIDEKLVFSIILLIQYLNI